MTDIDLPTERRDRAPEQFAVLGDLRPDAPLANFTKRGKPGWRRAADDAARQGPAT